ncbi:hypothetical protein MMC34_006040 [Xylographa carneopallida]|nr:hypothetical protein [Xylographa carneopallida]
MYMTLMSAYGAPLGIDFRFDGLVANTLQAHRVVQHYQEERGPDVTEKIIDSLYKQYFEQAQHPSSPETLLKATMAAGIEEAEAKNVIEAEDEELQDVKLLVREQAGNGVDSVPYIVFEGRRRDFTLEGAKEVQEYLKVLQQVATESS